jgi:hypothetical protein
MPTITTIEITEGAKPAMHRLLTFVKGRAANTAMGRAVLTLFIRHFLALPPNQRGLPTTHFWRRAANATTFEANPDSVRISVNQTGVMQRFLGGEIGPIRAKYLTIPAIAETYGHRAGDFSGLKVVRGSFWMYTGRKVSLALVPNDWKPNFWNPGDSSGVFFWLVGHVTQQPDSTVLPAYDDIGKTAVAAAANFFQRLRHAH